LTQSFRSGAVAISRALLVLLVTPLSTFAIIPEPDNILYGTISLNGIPVTPDMTNIVVEARRTSNGPAIASYRMGSDPESGIFYSLRISVESVIPLTGTNTSQANDALFMVLRDNSGIRGQTNFTIPERGAVQRFDFGEALGDIDGDGLPDGYEVRSFTNLNQTPLSLTTNGQTELQHFVTGTDPNNPNSGFWLYIDRSTNNLKRVWFTTTRAEGPGYDGLTRVYTLQYRPVLGSGFWADVPGYVNVVGTGQTVNYFTPGLGPNGFYRCCISLLGFSLPGGETGPLLTIRLGASNAALVSWPSPSTGFSLQQTASLNPTNWVAAPQTVNDDGTWKFINVAPPVGNRFYRLIKSQ